MMTDRNALKRSRVDFGHGPLAGTRTEQLAWLAQAVIERTTHRPVVWRWHESGYGGLYPNATTNQSTMVDVTPKDRPVFTVSVGRVNRDAWIARLHDAGYEAHPVDDTEYPGKVRLELDNLYDLANEVVREFLAQPWRPRSGREA